MKKYRVTLAADEREQVRALLARGKADVRKLKHAQILLKADKAEDGPPIGEALPNNAGQYMRPTESRT